MALKQNWENFLESCKFVIGCHIQERYGMKGRYLYLITTEKTMTYKHKFFILQVTW